MSKYTELSPPEVFRIAWDAREGNADREEVIQLLRFFCSTYEQRKPIPYELMSYLHQSISCYAANPENRMLEKCFGLKGKQGLRRNESRDQEIAKYILGLYLTGISLNKARAEAEEKYSLSRTVINEIWRKHKLDGLILLRAKRPSDCYPLSDEEQTRLTNIFPPRPPEGGSEE